jgi:hypothetical protein
MSQCFPTRPPINPLRLSSNYRDYYGDAHARLTELTDPILGAGCYVPRIVHAPDTPSELAGIPANGFLDYGLTLPVGSWILGFLHTYTSQASANATDPPVGSSFRLQITDVEREYKFFRAPVPEAYLLNDFPSSNPQAVTSGLLTVLNPSVRLLPSPYPVAPPGLFKLEFWNMLATVNTGIRLSLFVAEPDPDLD